MNRRDWLLATSAGAVLASQGARGQDARTYAPAIRADNHLFLMRPGTVRRYAPAEGRENQLARWPLQSEEADTLHAAVLPSLVELETWADAREVCCVGAAEAYDGLGDLPAIMAATVPGIADVNDIIGSLVTDLADGRGLNLTLDFRYAEDAAATALPHLGAPMVAPEFARRVATVSSLNSNQARSVTALGWRLQFRGPETHPLGSCVSFPVTHYNVELFREYAPGRYRYVVKSSSRHIPRWRPPLLCALQQCDTARMLARLQSDQSRTSGDVQVDVAGCGRHSWRGIGWMGCGGDRVDGCGNDVRSASAPRLNDPMLLRDPGSPNAAPGYPSLCADPVNLINVNGHIINIFTKC